MILKERPIVLAKKQLPTINHKGKNYKVNFQIVVDPSTGKKYALNCSLLGKKTQYNKFDVREVLSVKNPDLKKAIEKKFKEQGFEKVFFA
ncbi:MAG: hypothetical protein V1847_03565 [Candidatus Diapherotrites archaeon]